jgi:DNA-binding MarR family transcriptional regulator
VDSVGRLLGDWARRRPELAVAPTGVFARLFRIRALFERTAAAVLTPYELTIPDYEVLAHLTRLGADREPVRQYELQRAVALTPGTVSVRLDRLATRHLIQRLPDPASRRTTLVRLTPAGAALFTSIAPRYLANGQRLLDRALTADQQTQLADLLGRLLESFETHPQPPTPACAPPTDPAQSNRTQP